jgi:uncharacterized RDD family membrane protein YckC
MEHNPYQPPQTDVTPEPSSTPLASPWIRLGAAIIDGLVLWPVNWVIQRIFYTPPSQEQIAEMIRKTGSIPNIADLMPGRGIIFITSLLGIAAMIAINWNFLRKGQTVGKMLLKLQIQDRIGGTAMPAQRIITHRIMPIYGVYLLAAVIHPVLGMLAAIFAIIDALCIFRPNRNTIHDDIAGSKVVVLKD